MPRSRGNWLKRAVSWVADGDGRPGKGQRPGRPSRRPEVEELESRTVMQGGTWTAVAMPSPDPLGTQHIMLLSDGSVFVNGGGNPFLTTAWYRLIPDATGSYINGTWVATAPASTARLFFTSDVLRDGRVFVLGGEYTGAVATQTFTNTGEIYNPVTNTWTATANFPQPMFGDDPSEVLPDGDVLCGYLAGPQTYIYHPATNTFTQTGTKLRNDASDEETWVKLPDGSILSYDVFTNPGTVPAHAQRYIPATGQWVDAGLVPVFLSDPTSFELGPALRLPDGRIMFFGAPAGGPTAFYNPTTNTWTAGPAIPGGLGLDDAPAAILPNGDIIFSADTPSFNPPTQLFEFDYRTNTITPLATPAALTNVLSATAAFQTTMLILPSGQLLLNDNTQQLWIFTPNGGPQEAWKPHITNITNNNNGTFTLTGTQLNGISEGSNYGDDVENATNYPILRVTDKTGRVAYARTFNWSSTGVATGNLPVTTQFIMPAGIAQGALTFVVIANGIPSQPFTISPGTAYYPFRYVYNPSTMTYTGNLTIVNNSIVPVSGTFVVFLSLPPGVTLVNAAGFSQGRPFVVAAGTLAPHGAPLRITIQLSDPFRIPLSTFYFGFPIELQILG